MWQFWRNITVRYRFGWPTKNPCADGCPFRAPQDFEAASVETTGNRFLIHTAVFPTRPRADEKANGQTWVPIPILFDSCSNPRGHTLPTHSWVIHDHWLKSLSLENKTSSGVLWSQKPEPRPSEGYSGAWTYVIGRLLLLTNCCDWQPFLCTTQTMKLVTFMSRYYAFFERTVDMR